MQSTALTFECLASVLAATIGTLLTIPAHCAPVTLRWDYTATGAAGFMLYCGESSGSYASRIDVGNTDTHTISTLEEGSLAFCAVTAYDPSRAESAHSPEVSFTVGYAPPVAGFTASVSAGVAPLTVTFANTTLGAVDSWLWTFGDGNTSAARSPTHVYTNPGGYRPMLTVSGPGGTSTWTSPAAIAVSAPSASQTIVMQQRSGSYQGMIDATLDSRNPTRNYAGKGSVKLNGDRYAVLLRFAILAREGGPIPDNAQISSARLEIYKRDSYVHTERVHPVLKAWLEDQATWSDATSGRAWSVPGAAGGSQDFGLSHDAESTSSGQPGWMVFDVTDRVQQWRAGASNHGWKLVPVGGAAGLRSFGSSEYSNSALRPRLIVTYTTP